MSKIVDKSNWKKQRTKNNQNNYRIRVDKTRIFVYNNRKFYLGVIVNEVKKSNIISGYGNFNFC
jgi:hypothetical protein